MKIKWIIIASFILFYLPLNAQIEIKSGASLSVNGASIMQLHNTGIHNDGDFKAGAGTVLFTGDKPVDNSMISGNGTLKFYDLIIDKDSNGIMLETPINVVNVLGFSKGGLHLNGFDVDLDTTGHLVGEHDFSRIVSDAGGVVKAVREVTQSAEEPFGNLGLFLYSKEYLGWCHVERGTEALAIGNLNTIASNFYFLPEIDKGYDVRIHTEYIDTDIESNDKDELKLFQKIDSIWYVDDKQFHDSTSPDNSYFSAGIATESIISLAHKNAIIKLTIGNKLEPFKWNIWPNPASDEINIDLGNYYKRGQYVSVRNANGKIIRMAEVKEQVFKISCDNLPGGVYLIELSDRHNGIVTKKIVIE